LAASWALQTPAASISTAADNFSRIWNMAINSFDRVGVVLRVGRVSQLARLI